MTDELNSAPKKSSARSEAFEWAQTLISAVLLVVVVFTFVLRTVVVDGSSMNPTLYEGNTLIASRLFYEPKFGDIVVISQPNSHEKRLIKRVIATEGQTVFVDTENNIIYVDGEAVDDSFLGEPMNAIYGNEGPVVVPEGCVYVCGDNRNASFDSRSPGLGFVRTDYISGRIVFGLSPFGTKMLYSRR